MSNQALLEITTYEVANYLVKHGYAEQGSGLLNDLIVNDPKAVTARCVRTLAQIAYECKSWPDAEALWRVAANAEPSNAEAWIKLAHSLVEQGRPAEAEASAGKAKALLASRPKDLADSDVNAWVAGIHDQICLSFLGNELRKATDLVRTFALPGTYLASVTTGQSGTDRGPAVHDSAMQQRLQDALRTWEAGGATVPYLRQRGGAIAEEPIQPTFAERKVLLVFRKYFLDRADSREHELGGFMQASAKAVGLEPLFFPADPFLNPKTVQPQRQYSELDRLGRTILSFRPDLVIFDDLCNQETTGEYLSPQVYVNVFQALKQQHRFKLAGLYMDSWSPRSWHAMELASSVLDLVWPLDFSPPPAGAQIPESKIFRAPVPYPEAWFDARPGGKDISAGFVGSLADYNAPRGIWLTLIKARKIPCELFLSLHTTSGSKAGATAAEYAAFISRLKISVNFSARCTGRKIMTGRTWESILARAFLLEEDNEEIKRFFVPFVHYIPFRNIDELQAYLSFFERHEELRRAIAERAYQWFLKCFSKERIWRDLISTVPN